MHVAYALHRQRLVHPLRVSHTAVESVWVATLETRLRHHTGVGEVAIGPWTQEDPHDVASAAADAVRRVPRSGWETPPGVGDVRAAIEAGALREVSPTCRMLAEMALLDLAGSWADAPVWRLLHLPAPEPARLWRTISVGAGFAAAPGARLKMKLGGPLDREVLDALEGSEAEVIVDVNCGWRRQDWLALRDRLQRVRLVALEDPVADPQLLHEVRASLPRVPILLDEGVRTEADIETSADRADGANVKLLKFGGLIPAERALRRLSALGKRRMLGCFVEPPRAIAYAAQLASLADWTDLDGHLLLEGGDPTDTLVVDSSGPGIPRLSRG